jgi:ATP-dependent Lon protease
MAPKKFDKKKYNFRNDKKKNLKKNKDSDDEGDIIEFDDDSEYESESDSSYLPSPKEEKKKGKKGKKAEISESDEESIDSEDIESDQDEEDEKMSPLELKQTLARIFPSKYANEKVHLQKLIDEENKEKEQNKANKCNKYNKKKEQHKPTKSINKKEKSKPTKTNKKYKKEESSEDEDEEDDDEQHDEDHDDEDDEEDEEDEEEDEEQKINIVFTIGGGGDEDEWEDYDEDELDESNDDIEEYNSDDEKTYMKENYKEIEMPTELNSSKNDEKTSKTDKSSKKSKVDKKKDKKKEEDQEEQIDDVESEYLELQELKKHLTEKLHKNPNSKILLNAIEECKETIYKIIKDARKKNTKNYHKLVTSDRKKPNEMDYFKNKLSNKEQLQVMKDLKEINSHVNIEKPYRLSLLESKMPAKFKAIALQKLNALRSMEPGDSEYYKIKNWVDTFMKIPFGIEKSLSVNMSDGIEKCHDFMENAKNILDNCVYGLDDAKMQIMQMVGQWISNPGAMGTAIAIKGPMGTGKTSLIKDGISKIFGREFTFIALGGAGDSSFLEGHSYTYEGSSWGKIVQILIDSKCMNPIIYFDELDKVSDTPKGEEIIGILTHLTDTTQNNQFHDKYFSEVDFDISKCLFIFSYNDESKVNPVLRDRMYRIQTKGYDAKDKTIIARKYLLPKIREQVNFKEEDVIIPDDTIQYIASTTALTNSEAGVRNLKRCLEIIHTKLNLFRLIKPGEKLFDKDMDIKVEFPFTVTKQHVDIFIKNEEKQNQSLLAMYV